MKKIEFSNGAEVPSIGFGTWKLTSDVCVNAVLKALEVGYRHIDTADVYGNHIDVGNAILRSGLDRSEIFLTTKVWWTDLNAHNLVNSVERFLDELKTNYIDLLLIHWPNRKINIKETLDAMFALTQIGKIKHFGVSNFTIHHIKDALESGHKILVNQVEFHPSLNQKKLKEYCDQENIIITAYSPIAQGKDLELQVISELSLKYGKTESQIILNWLLSKNMIVIPRAKDETHIRENFESNTFTMSQEDYKKIEDIGGNNRIVLNDFSDFEY